MIYYDLKIEAERHGISNVVARDSELKRMVRTMIRQYNNNVAVHGSSGSGKSALIEGFAYKIAKKEIPGFEDFALVKLDSNDLKRFFSQSNHAETYSYLSTAFKNLPENCIIFIDDFQNIFSENKFLEAAAIFEPFFERSDLRLAITFSESGYKKLREENANFLQHFEDIELKESDLKETETIINALGPSFQKEYGVKISPAAIKEATTLSKKINSDKKLPLKAIHLLDESIAFAKAGGLDELSPKEVKEIFAEKTGIPGATLNSTDKSLLKNLQAELDNNVIGQGNATKIISDVIRRSRMGLRNPNRPYGSFLFLGPSGVGKTELSKILAKIVYGSERAFTRIDMSEFGEQHTVQRLIGAPPGYVGFEAGGQLTNAIKQQPYSLILLDEIEKAHPKIFDIFLQVFDDGRLTDGQGQTINFTNSIVISTSNLGINEIVNAFRSGADINSAEFLREELMPILYKNFRIEFLNRFDAIIVFNPLSRADLLKIALLEIKKIEERTAEHNIKFNINGEVLAKKIAELEDYRLGARPIKRFVEQTCENLIALKLMNS
jgi:ATP-dependent Clp protease ATP-binding subunit ClpC